MAYKDLRHFLKVLEEAGELKRITTEVDPDLEIAEIADRMMKTDGPALMFENVKGSEFPLVINILGSEKRMNLALEVNDINEIGERILDIIEPELPSNIIQKVKMLPKLKQIADFFPRTVSKGPCQEVVITENPSLDIIPALKSWPQDGGKFFTFPLVFTKDPKSGVRNCGMYRMHIYDERTTGMHWHVHKHGARHYKDASENGKPLEVAVAFGCDPAVLYSATAPLPDDIDEMIFAGFLRGSSVNMVKCKTIDVEVPANAEIVLEGYVNPGELRTEGPFGDHTGYYSLADEYPVFHLKAITHRKNPVYPCTIVGKPPMEDCFMGKATERIFLPLLKKTLPEIVDMNLPIEGIFHNFIFVSIDKRYPGQAQKVMHAIWGTGQMMFIKFIVVLDKHVNIQDLSEVIWRMGNNVDPQRDISVVKGPVDALDHVSAIPHLGAKMGIDATKKGPKDGHFREWPDDIVMPDDIKALVDGRWKEYGLDEQ
ncbi:menaquinone biosynthesis decarboxylase [Thermodesulfobacteriota bacterium]